MALSGVLLTASIGGRLEAATLQRSAALDKGVEAHGLAAEAALLWAGTKTRPESTMSHVVSGLSPGRLRLKGLRGGNAEATPDLVPLVVPDSGSGMSFGGLDLSDSAKKPKKKGKEQSTENSEGDSIELVPLDEPPLMPLDEPPLVSLDGSEPSDPDLAAEAAAFETSAMEPPQAKPSSGRGLLRQWWVWAVVGGVVLASGGVAVAASGPKMVLPSGSLGTLDRR